MNVHLDYISLHLMGFGILKIEQDNMIQLLLQ